ncbi:hypothetical protein BN1708_002403 [Verticillium longisporum]|uniref:Uncharacterized protein n=1 Tax=Verticillium longisporum TaxID=100787 RepID=A0A0G4KQN2_VERLO|nr:hypothetical protein HYQ44_006278 [Verticillium longisporum]CRK12006.1 hypothetical protein BN1708_002403 [Verticillium longisporum]
MSRPRNWTWRGGLRPADATAIPGNLKQKIPAAFGPLPLLPTERSGAVGLRLLNASPWCQVRNNGGSFWGLGVPDRERSCRSMPLAVVFDLSLVFRRDRS